MRIIPPSVYVTDTGTSKGKGVFAAKAFNDGEVVEVCSVVPFSPSAARLPQELERRMFNWGYLIGSSGLHAFALGYGSLYNHNNPANMRYEADQSTQVLRFVAARHIDVDEELTINYNAHGGGAEWNDDAWFERMKVRPV